MMPSTVAMPMHQANKVAPAAPRRSSVWVPRETSIQSAVNRTMPAAPAATAEETSSWASSEYRSSSSCLRKRGPALVPPSEETTPQRQTASPRGGGTSAPFGPRRPSQLRRRACSRCDNLREILLSPRALTDAADVVGLPGQGEDPLN